MNAEKKKTELKTNDFNKDVKVKDGNEVKTYRVKIPKERDVDFPDKEEYGAKQEKTIKAKAVESNDANKSKMEKIDEQPDVDIVVALDKNT